MRQAFIHRLGASAPNDVAPLAAAIADRRLLPAAIVAVLGKTEGNGCVNDFSRGLAAAALRRLLERHLPADRVAETPRGMAGGAEGGVAPHGFALEARPATGGVGPALAVGRARTPRLE